MRRLAARRISVHRSVGQQAPPVLALTASDSYGAFIALPVTSRPQAEHSPPLTTANLVSAAGGKLDSHEPAW
jgi:hypothetical protein